MQSELLGFANHLQLGQFVDVQEIVEVWQYLQLMGRILCCSLGHKQMLEPARFCVISKSSDFIQVWLR